jgi:hypothetical protein
MNSIKNFRFPGLALVVAVAFPVALFSVAAPAASGVEMARIRIESPTESVKIEMPVTVLEYVLDHSKENSFEIGQVKGKEVKFPREALLKTLRDKSARDKDLLFFSVKEEGKETKLFLRTEMRKESTSAKKPSRMVFTVREKGGKESVNIGLGLEMIESWASGYGKGDEKEKGDDFGPFVRACLAEAKKLGPGPILKIEGQDGTISFELE